MIKIGQNLSIRFVTVLSSSLNIPLDNGRVGLTDADHFEAFAFRCLRPKAIPHALEKANVMRKYDDLGAFLSALPDFLNCAILSKAILAVERIVEDYNSLGTIGTVMQLG
jgi:hypothetical protein